MNEETEEELKRIEKEETLVPVNEISSTSMTGKLLRKYYEPKVLEHLTLTKAQIQIITNGLRTFNKNIIQKSIALVCLGPDCFMANKCCLQEARCAPIGSSCLIEKMLIDQWEHEYLEDLDIDNSKIERDMVRDMIEMDIIDWRTSNELSKNNSIFDWQIVGMDEKTGKPYYRKEESVALGIKLKLKAKKDKLREDLMATRKVKAKFGVDKRIDPSRYASDLRMKYEAVKEAQVEDIKED